MARRAQRAAGDRSARLAHALMKLPASALGALGLDEDLREAVNRARAVTANVARRRAERTLAGELRRVDLIDLEGRLEVASGRRRKAEGSPPVAAVEPADDDD